MTSVSMTINGPAATMTAFFMNAAIDQQCEVYIREKGLEKQVNAQIDAIYTKKVLLDEKEFKILGFQAIPAMKIGERDFSPRSFMPVVGYKTYAELDQIISKIY
jgi:hypothetical protein